ncbi:hypothetical protein CesoFtcFv8_023716 [Champsocephalus esox]|uniref:Uncharacterized protein n=1 Tax=Champsocephalus esox TaxID=159716 RepID=A0AAN8B4C6_9TELE|nr:hypothetical protein CesoFtcFv8_023716 [Champsocephalus esox]
MEPGSGIILLSWNLDLASSCSPGTWIWHRLALLEPGSGIVLLSWNLDLASSCSPGCCASTCSSRECLSLPLKAQQQHIAP